MSEKEFDFDLEDLYDKLTSPSANISEGNSNQSTDVKRKGGRKVFPQILYEMLQKSVEEGFDSIVSWTSNGSGLIIHKRKEFELHVLPKYFQQTKTESFLRQLNNYGFTRIEKGKESGSYKHKYLFRGKPELIKLIERKPVAKEKPESIDLAEIVRNYNTKEESKSAMIIDINK